VIVVRRLRGQAVVSILMKPSPALPNKIAAPARDFYSFHDKKRVK